MAATFVDEGIDLEAQILVNKEVDTDLYVICIEDNTAFAQTDTYATHTPTTLTGGAEVDLVGANWTGGVASGIATYAYPAITWTFAPYAGGTTLYGYIVYRKTPGNILIYGEQFATPYAVPSGGGILILSLVYQHEQCP